MSLFDKLKNTTHDDEVANNPDPATEISADAPEESTPAPAISPAGQRLPMKLGLKRIAPSPIDVSVPARPAPAAQPAEHPEMPEHTRTVLRIIEEMTRRGIAFDQPNSEAALDTQYAKAWIGAHIHYLPTKAPAGEDDGGGHMERNDGAAPTAEQNIARDEAVRNRRALRHRYYQSAPFLPNLTIHNREDGSREYRFPKTEKLAFTERNDSLSFDQVDVDAIRCGIELAVERQWPSIKLTGTPEFMSAAYIEATIAGIKVDGYEPTAADMEKLAALEINPQPATSTDLKTTIANALAKGASPTSSSSKGLRP